MTWTLFLGDPAYSSWSMRGWLLFDRFNIDVDLTWISFLDDDVAPQVAALAPARTVPCARTSEGAILWDSLALAEELAQRSPEAGFWPTDPNARATARSLAAEMHSGFMDLRADCPMNFRQAHADFEPSGAVMKDLERLETIWAFARDRHGGEAGWLCGGYSIADAFFAPVASRIATYGLPVGPVSQAYVDTHLADLAFRRWRTIGLTKGQDLQWYMQDRPQRDWPGPSPISATVVATGPSVNSACPYSDGPTNHFLEVGGKTYGFCNAECRDETATDPEAWPKFMALIR